MSVRHKGEILESYDFNVQLFTRTISVRPMTDGARVMFREVPMVGGIAYMGPDKFHQFQCEAELCGLVYGVPQRRF